MTICEVRGNSSQCLIELKQQARMGLTLGLAEVMAEAYCKKLISEVAARIVSDRVLRRSCKPLEKDMP